MVTGYHQLGKERGPAYATLAMCCLRAVLNLTIIQYEDSEGNPILRDNPVLRLTRTRAWYPDKRRHTLIQVHQFPTWFKAVRRLREEEPFSLAAMLADYLDR